MKSKLIIWKFCCDQVKLIFIVGIFVIIFCELYMIIPFLPHRLEYQPDEELIAVLRPNQVGYDWLGNMSYKSPLISLNSDGHRGRETDWTKPVILTSGNSDSMGAGVEDEEVWTVLLENNLRQENDLENIQVVNASHLGHGPFHHYIRIRRVLDIHNVEAIIVRVDMADRYFVSISKETLVSELQKAKQREKIRNYTKGIPFLVNKMAIQWKSIRSNLKNPRIFRKKEKGYRLSETDGLKMWEKNHIWWKKIISSSTKKDIPIVFMLYDIYASKASAIIYQKLNNYASNTKENVYIFRIGPQQFGLNSKDKKQIQREIDAKLTIKRDPHANALQHNLIAHSILKFFKETKLISKIRKNKNSS